MQVYRGLPILSNQPERPTRSSRSGRSTTRPPSASTSGSRTRRSTRSSPRAGRRSSPAAPVSTSARRCRAGAPAAARARRARPLGGVLRRPRRRARPRPPRRRSTRRRPPPSTRTTGAASCGRSSSRRPALARARGQALGRGVPAPDAALRARGPRRTSSTRRIERRTRAMFDAGRRGRGRDALAGPISRRRGTCSASTRSRRSRARRRAQTLVVRTRRYAAYQRKWLRRIPGLVSVRADRSAAEVADEILDVARARQRLSPG